MAVGRPFSQAELGMLQRLLETIGISVQVGHQSFQAFWETRNPVVHEDLAGNPGSVEVLGTLVAPDGPVVASLTTGTLLTVDGRVWEVVVGRARDPSVAPGWKRIYVRYVGLA